VEFVKSLKHWPLLERINDTVDLVVPFLLPGATNDEALVEQVAKVTAIETAAAGR